jgi:hypothetical protein
MTLPIVPELTDVMEGLTLKPISDGHEHDPNMRLVPSFDGFDEAGNVERLLKLGLWNSTGTKLGIDRFLERVSRELAAKGHETSTAFCLLIVSIALLRPGSGAERLNNLNAAIGAVRDANLSLYYMSNVQLPAFYTYEIPPFRLGPLRSDKLKWNCEKAGSDFFDRYRSRIGGKWTIERHPKKVPVIDIPKLREAIFGRLVASHDWKPDAWESLVTAYFSQQNRAQFLSMWDELLEAQDALVTMGAPYLDPRPFTSAFGGMQVAVFLRVGSGTDGFVAPASPGLIGLDLANAHERVPKALGELRDRYGFEAFDASPLHGTLRLFASFVSRARRHEIDGRASDALLHYVIALELVFGELQNIQRSVSERVATITSKGRIERYDAERRRIDALYEARSKYVHAGVSLGDGRLVSDAFDVCGECFRALLSLQAALTLPNQRNEGVLESWLGELDYLGKGMIAGKSPSGVQLTEAHIGGEGPGQP